MAEKKKMKSEDSSSNTNNYAGGESSHAPESIVMDVGRRRTSCGYCRSGGHTSISHGLWAQSLTVDDYQALLDRGWRRSGCFLYKPEMERTCCPSYTIRLKASEFVPSKEQLRVSKRMQSHCLTENKYVVLSNFTSFTNGEPKILDDPMEEQHDGLFHGGKNEMNLYQDEERAGLDSEESDDESDPETSYPPSAQAQDGDVGNILIGMESVRLKFKDLCQAFGPGERRYMETQLQRYMQAVGVELSERMVYSTV